MDLAGRTWAHGFNRLWAGPNLLFGDLIPEE